MAKQETAAELEKQVATLKSELNGLIQQIQGPPYDDEPDFDNEVSKEAEQRGVPEEIVRAEWLQSTVKTLEKRLGAARLAEEQVRLKELAQQIKSTTAQLRDQSVSKLRNRVAIGAAAVIVEDLRLIPGTSGVAHELAFWSLAFAGLAASMVSVGYITSVVVYSSASLRAQVHAKQVLGGATHVTDRLGDRIKSIELALVGIQTLLVAVALFLALLALK